ncbi:hypothetical protein LN574_16555, partial [Xanthomonas euvesicatoria pv. euvesicatoria]|uniref:hypothetical protein n=1 Tax=Xanthomonas euvesicatoria TaxID=456327 RepID=UPI001E4095D5
GVALVLRQSRREARDPLLQLSQFGGAAGHLAPGGVARLAFCLQYEGRQGLIQKTAKSCPTA